METCEQNECETRNSLKVVRDNCAWKIHSSRRFTKLLRGEIIWTRTGWSMTLNHFFGWNYLSSVKLLRVINTLAVIETQSFSKNSFSIDVTWLCMKLLFMTAHSPNFNTRLQMTISKLCLQAVSMVIANSVFCLLSVWPIRLVSVSEPCISILTMESHEKQLTFWPQRE